MLLCFPPILLIKIIIVVVVAAALFRFRLFSIIGPRILINRLLLIGVQRFLKLASELSDDLLFSDGSGFRFLR